MIIRPSIHYSLSFIHPFIYNTNLPFYPFLHLYIHPSIHPSIHPPTRRPFHPSIHPFLHPPPFYHSYSYSINSTMQYKTTTLCNIIWVIRVKRSFSNNNSRIRKGWIELYKKTCQLDRHQIDCIRFMKVLLWYTSIRELEAIWGKSAWLDIRRSCVQSLVGFLTFSVFLCF